MEVHLHLKGQYPGVGRTGRTCCTRGEDESERGGLEYLLGAVLVVVELFSMIMISK